MSSHDHVVLEDDNGETFVQCKSDKCDCKTSMQELLSQCSRQVKLDLLKSALADGSSGMASSRNTIELIASSNNIHTDDLFQVIMFRANEMDDKGAKEIMKDLIPGQYAPPQLPMALYSSEETDDVSEDSAVTKLVWVDEHAPATEAQNNFSVADTWILLEDIANKNLLHHKIEELNEQMIYLDNMMKESSDETGESQTRRFVRWASTIIGVGEKSEYPFKLYSDALLLDRFIDHMNTNYGSLTLDQYASVKTRIFTQYQTKSNEYGAPRQLQMLRFTLEWTESSKGELNSYWVNNNP